MKIILLMIMVSNIVFAIDTIIKNPLEINSPIKVSGDRGYDGADGRDGSDGRCYWDRDGDYIISNGGHGGDGGDGQDGSNGDDGDSVLIYYNNISDIKHLVIYSWGGSGGYGGKGGSGGEGCGGGRDGSDGSDGDDGYEGAYGYLYIIKHSQTYKPTISRKNITLKEFKDKTVEFRKNYWLKKPNALNLVNSKSEIQKSYYAFDKSVVTNVSIDWKTSKDFAKYSKIKAEILFDGEKLSVNFEKAFVDFEVVRRGNQTQIVVHNIFTSNELLSFSDFKLTGVKESLTLKFSIDSEDLNSSDLKIQAHFFRKMFLSPTFKHFFSGNLNDYILIDKNSITVYVGKLPFKQRFIKRKKKIQINLDFRLKLFGKTLVKTYYIGHKIGSGSTELL